MKFGLNNLVMKKIFTIMGLLAFIPSAHAELSVSEYKQLNSKVEKKLVNLYLKGIHEGLAYANIKNDLDGNPSLYCAPENLVIETENLKTILEKQIIFFEKNKGKFKTYDPPVAALLLFGLSETFPCSEKEPATD